MPPGDPDQKPYAVKDFEWFNKLLNIFAMEWSSAQFFKVTLRLPSPAEVNSIV